MRILIYTLHYAPELTGVGKYTGEMASWLGARGHEIRVVTAHSYYLLPEAASESRRGFYRIEPAQKPGEPRVYRCPLWVANDLRGVGRLLHLCSFAVSSIPVIGMQTRWKPDLIFVVEPTLFVAPVALLAAAACGARSWLHIQDLEVEVAFGLRFLPEGGGLRRFAKLFEVSCNRSFSRVSSISNKMVGALSSRGVGEDKAVLFPNWSDVEKIQPAKPGAENYFRKHYRLEGKTVLLYSGNMGNKQGLEILVPLAEAFAHDRKVHFVFCGEGSFRAQLAKLVGRLKNVTMLPLQSKELLNDLLNVADIHLLPQVRGVADWVMPSKLNGMLSSGRPIIATADEGTQLATIVESCGVVVPPSQPRALAAAAKWLIEDPKTRAQLGEAAREYAVKNLSKEKVLRQFERDLMDLVPPQNTLGRPSAAKASQMA